MDVRMPGGDGIEATRTLAGPGVLDPVAVIVVTAFDLDEYIFGALDAGASGFLLKDAGRAVLTEAVRAAARGDAVVSPTVTPRVIAEFARRQTGERGGSADRAADVAAAGLTAREQEIIRALARGMNNAEIARHLHLVPGTVKTHLTRINAKIGTRDRLQIAIWAFAHDLVQPDNVPRY
ncbi:response regulator transcription factor [Cellulomonas sp. 73-145]|uniref:response regulator transcription factor n=1 Tax=Cellulomonas sp. 73-145 TaxID=1895739 RepID=UPI000A9AF7EE